MKRLLAGDKAGAMDHFKKSVATNRVDYVEYRLAGSEIQTLGAQK
jgi:lipoprotein NlpI